MFTHFEVRFHAVAQLGINRVVLGTAALRESLPGWLKWVSLAGFCASLFSLLVSVYPFVDVVNPLGYAAKIAGTVVISNAVAAVFYKLRNRGNT